METLRPIGLNAWVDDMLQASWKKIRYRFPISTEEFLARGYSKIAPLQALACCMFEKKEKARCMHAGM